ncbi:beta-N-acetylhexosaminidase [Flammeovirga pectinis]|uniref:beta-N-acetylhexosaminidase n=1 Tax=Flammeovirga pectinis TaxID=2494373 RepID=A0A3S9P1P9_9BACT|nr:beta-N-acetylhexosaminidase [Flammeovirga pectinis]AZQ62123.1 beta-N-acetylhexosaminidase [Flammeovirga pectinis]
MKLNLFTLFIVTLLLGSCSEQKVERPSLIPLPQNITWGESFFELRKDMTIAYQNNGNEKLGLSKFKTEVKELTAISLIEVDTGGDITLKIDNTTNRVEAYTLDVSSNNIKITATTEQGLMYGLETLIQLIPESGEVPLVSISDTPKFPWRGMMLDVSRHFFTTDEIKEYLDLMAHYKMNKFHWHLTEDQGWRIEIKKYPKLTENSAWRTEKDGSKYGGFYTQEEIKDVVAYAQKRGIEVIPEIDMPGHMVAALASYPEYSCTGGPFEVWNDWGVNMDVLCAGNDNTYTFIENILEEIMPLFPSKYMHIGGDECPKDRWKECDKCQAKIKKEGLADEHQLQSFYIHQIEKIVNKNGKKMIGWDEILEGGLSETATVQLWRDFHDQDAVRKIALMGNDVIVSPTGMCYFDYDIETTDLEQVYNYNPIPKGVSPAIAKHIIGGECTLWSERIPNKKRLDFQTFPRLLALSEALWTGTKEDGYPEFHNRVLGQYSFLDRKGVAFGPSSKVMNISTEEVGGKFTIAIEPLIEGIDVKYKPANSTSYIPYQEPITISTSGEIKFQGFRGDKPYGEEKVYTFILHKGNSANISLSVPPSKDYACIGQRTLIDSRIGSATTFRDGNWQGFVGSDVVATLTWDTPQSINSIKVSAFEELGSWIALPKGVEFYYSKDGKDFKSLEKLAKGIKDQKGQVWNKKLQLSSQIENVKSIKVVYKSGGVLPKGHPGEGNPSYIFIDEIIVK